MIRARTDLQDLEVQSPTRLQCTLSYIANGNLPPLPRIPPAILDGLLSFTISTAACLGLGVLIGRGIVQ
jgi:hypothetical protein